MDSRLSHLRQIADCYLCDTSSGNIKERVTKLSRAFIALKMGVSRLGLGLESQTLEGRKGRVFFHSSLNRFVTDYSLMHLGVGRRMWIVGLPGSGQTFVANLLRKGVKPSNLFSIDNFVSREQMVSVFSKSRLSLHVGAIDKNSNAILEGRGHATSVWQVYNPHDVVYLVPDVTVLRKSNLLKAKSDFYNKLLGVWMSLSRVTQQEMLDLCVDDWINNVDFHASACLHKVNIHFVRVHQDLDFPDIKAWHLSRHDW